MRLVPLASLLTLLAAAALLPLGAAAADDDEAPPTPTPAPLLIRTHGVVVSEQEALERIRFRPFVPVPRPLEIALIAPIHNGARVGDNPANYGIAFEYVQRGRRFFLREWPMQGAGLGTFQELKADPACNAPSYILDGGVRELRGVGWQTQHTIVVLQLDDGNAPIHDRGAAIKTEWHRLALRGACR